MIKLHRFNFIFLITLSFLPIKSYALNSCRILKQPPDSLSFYYREFNKIDLENAEMLPIYDFQIDETEKMLESIKSDVFVNAYGYQLRDTSGFALFCNEVRIKRVIIDQCLTSLDYHFCKKADELLLKGDTGKAILLYLKAIDQNLFYIPASLKLTNLYAKTGRFSECIPIALSVYGKIFSNNDFYPSYLKMLGNIYEEFIIQGNSLLFNKNYYEALDLFNESAAYCKAINEEACDNRLSSGISQAKTGIYHSIFSIAHSALMSGQTDLALQYTCKAEKYLAENNSDIVPGDEKDEFYLCFSGYYIQMGKNALKGKAKFLSGFYLSKAISLADSVHNPYKKNLLTGRINKLMSSPKKHVKASSHFPQKRYLKRISRHKVKGKNNEVGIHKEVEIHKVKKTSYDSSFIVNGYKNLVKLTETFMQQNDYDSAYAVINEAWIYAEKYSIKDTTLKLVIVQNLHPQISRQIGDALFETWRNQLDKARLMYSGVCKTIEKYKLNNCPVISEAINNLKMKIDEKECENTQNRYESWMIKARGCVENQDFIKASVYLDTAANIKFPDNNCKPDITEAKILKGKYNEAANYQQKLKQAYSEYQNKNFCSAVASYTEAADIYMEHDLIDLKIVHLSISDYTLKTEDNSFILFVIPFLVEKNNCKEALLLLYGLKKAGYHKSGSESFQITVGECLSGIDWGNDRHDTPASSFIRLNIEDEWFSPLRKAYIRKWKNKKN